MRVSKFWRTAQATVTIAGMEVLNSASLVFVDIDEPIFRFWQIFRWRSRIESPTC